MLNRPMVNLLLLVIGAFVLLTAGEANAIPAFSRQHKTECSTCHTIFSELNEYGDAFLKNAYVPIGKPSAATAEPAPTPNKNISGAGDPELLKMLRSQALAEKKTAKDNKPAQNEGIRLSGIPELVPISFRATQNITFNNDPPDSDKSDFSTRTFALNAGGNFREDYGFFATYLISSHAANGADPNNLHELFLVWRHILDTPINLKVGRFEPKISLWKKSNKITTASSFATMSFKANSSPFSLESSQEAIEANAIIGNRVFVATGLVDRNPLNTKEVYGHISVKIGGSDLLGVEPEIDLDNESLWDYLTLTLAGFGYYGRNTINDTDTQIKDHFYRAGGEMDLTYKRFRLKTSGVYGWDSNADYSAHRVDTIYGVVTNEAEVLLGSPINTALILRHEVQDDTVGITRRLIPAIAYAPLQNMKLSLEYRYEDAPMSTSRITLLGVSYSF